jgi:tRNA pseudouridine55 synthase
MNDDEPPLPEVNYLEGSVLLVDKPQNWTSFDVVAKIRSKLRRIYQVKKIKVGHAGTLDPMATGLLIVCTGKDTKRITEYQDQPKEYTGTMHLGATTPSYDAETEPDAHFPIQHITEEMLQEALTQFMGDIEQVPPMFSAIKVDGQPLYKKARKGEVIEIQARKVHIYTFELTRIALPEVDFLVRCSKGTYIRSLAHDLAKVVGSGAYLTALRRTKIGDYTIEDAYSIEGLMEKLSPILE